MQRIVRVQRPVRFIQTVQTQRALFHKNVNVFGETSYDPVEKSREEEWAHKRDIEIVKKLVEQMHQTTHDTHIKVERHTSALKQEVKDHLEKQNKENDKQIDELKKKIDELQELLQSAIKNK